MKINIQIERLVLDGVAVERSGGAAIQRAVEAELTRLLAEHGLSGDFQKSLAAPRVPGGTMRLTADARPGPLGERIARAVHGAIGPKQLSTRVR